MKHNIIVKFKKDAPALNEMLDDIKAIFSQTLSIEGIHNVKYLMNCVDRPNRYDLVIQIDMDRDALADYDACSPHRQWKEKYGPYIDSKAIFDYE